LEEHVQGLVGDVGDLAKMMMAKNGFRFSESDADAGMAKELADCLLSVMMIAGELEVDLEKEVLKNIKKLEEGIEERRVIRRK